jgi:ATP-dependent protease ClpP protease subunit
MSNTIRHAVRDHKGRFHSSGIGGTGGAASVIATATHNATRTGKAHSVVQIDLTSGATRGMPIKPGDTQRPVAGNQVFRSTAGGR